MVTMMPLSVHWSNRPPSSMGPTSQEYSPSDTCKSPCSVLVTVIAVGRWSLDEIKLNRWKNPGGKQEMEGIDREFYSKHPEPPCKPAGSSITTNARDPPGVIGRSNPIAARTTIGAAKSAPLKAPIH